ncbi:MAG: LysM peptidoglycan-binding domain-containing protein [Alphaproteobacteria bacterium]|nr:LysM peptidoglycan-binding domain-containing protein [Alphaproteobacteria bacterium]
MNKTPLVVFSGLVVAAAAATGYFALLRPATPPLPQKVEAPAQLAPAAPEAKPAEAQPVAAAQAAPQPASPPEVVPSFDTARISPDGNAVIAGRAAPGADVALQLNGTTIATAKANDAGEFVITPEKPLPEGEGALSLLATSGDKATPSSQTVAVSIKPKAPAETTVAVLAPGEAPKVVQAPKAAPDSVSIDAVDYDGAGAIQFAGRAHAGNDVRLYVDNALAGDARADASGNWAYKDEHGIAPGTHELRADEVTQDGSVLSRVALPFKREEPAKLAETQQPAAPADGNAAASPVAPQPHTITVQPGNNLWRLSRDIYGAGRNYTIIFEANKGQIRNPGLIYPGQILTAPSKTGQ